jgi:site-specific DNA recombinase
LQRRELHDYCQRRGWQIVGEYADTGWSGSNANRPELTRLMNDARKRRFDAVLVWKLDRWGRCVPDSIKSIQELASLGIRFIAVTQNIDTDERSPMSRFLLVIMSAFAADQRGHGIGASLDVYTKSNIRQKATAAKKLEDSVLGRKVVRMPKRKAS